MNAKLLIESTALSGEYELAMCTSRIDIYQIERSLTVTVRRSLSDLARW